MHILKTLIGHWKVGTWSNFLRIGLKTQKIQGALREEYCNKMCSHAVELTAILNCTLTEVLTNN